MSRLIVSSAIKYRDYQVITNIERINLLKKIYLCGKLFQNNFTHTFIA